MENTLFIGNGLNRCLSNGVAWANLLEETANKYQTSFFADTEMPMEFERIVNEYLQNSYSTNIGLDRKDIYKEIKENIAQLVTSDVLDENSIHKKIPFGSIQNIITSNYDFLLEEAIGSVNWIKFKKNKKYLEEKTATSQDGKISIFHAHGMANYPDTICLGYEHYMGVVERLRSSINRNHKKAKDIDICEILTKRTKEKNTWGEKFYTSNVAFIGFGLPFCETDIWWLLTHRAYLFNTNNNQIRNALKNTIVYYDIIEEGKKEDAKLLYKHRLLENLHVVVRTKRKTQDESYTEKYRDMFNEIENGSCWEPIT